MKTVNSLSGGKTSSFIASHYPADYDIFALVCIDNHNAGKDIDHKLKQMANDKLQKYCSHMPEFVATAEDPIILKTMFDLEQHIGREIIWLRGIAFDDMISLKRAIPNIQKRFCTTILKMQPIFEFLYTRTNLPVQMRIGYRHDEMERANTDNVFFKYSSQMQYSPFGYKLDKSGNIHYGKWRNKFKTINWRKNQYPLIDNKISHRHIIEYWNKFDIPFAIDSNCQMCFWKNEQQLRKNFDNNKPIMQWAQIMEDLQQHTFKERYSLNQIKILPIQLDFNFGTGSGCMAGFCTD